MSLIKTLLLEFQEKNYLYHFSSPENIIKIIKSNVLKRGYTNIAVEYSGHSFGIDFDKRAVSLTRNKEFGGGLALAFDRRKLKNKYKLYPLSAISPAEFRSEFRSMADSGAEEVIIKDVKPVDKFLEFIYVPDWNFEHMNENQKKALDFIIKNNIPLKQFKSGNFINLNRLWES